MNVDEQIIHGENVASDILEHFGVLGMQWGKRKEEKRTEQVRKDKKPMSNKARTGAIVAGTLLALYGARRIASLALL